MQTHGMNKGDFHLRAEVFLMEVPKNLNNSASLNLEFEFD